jgi:hypothetical protein
MALIDTIIAQNTPFHSAYPSRPHGVPSYWNWYNGRWVNNATNPYCTSLAAWGQVFPIKGSTRNAFGKFETRWHRGWVHRKAGGWKLAQAAGTNYRTEGGAFRANFAGNAATRIQITQQLSTGGAQMTLPLLGDCVHWWPAPRASFVANEINWCYHQQDVRVTDARDQFCVQIGVDWWKSPTATYPNNPVAAHSNWVKLTTSWVTIGMFSCTAAQFRADLPTFLR